MFQAAGGLLGAGCCAGCGLRFAIVSTPALSHGLPCPSLLHVCLAVSNSCACGYVGYGVLELSS